MLSIHRAGDDLVVAVDSGRGQARAVADPGITVDLDDGRVRVQGATCPVLVHLDGRPVQRIRGDDVSVDLRSVIDTMQWRASCDDPAGAVAAAVAADVASGTRHRYEITPDPPGPGEPAIVHVRTDRAIDGGTVAYRVDGGDPEQVALEPAEEFHWTAQIPGQDEGAVITYCVDVVVDGRTQPVADAGPSHILPVGREIVARPADTTFDYRVGAPAPPAWVRDAVGYHALVDRFAGPDGGTVDTGGVALLGFAGGTLAGVSARLDHLRALGVDLVLLSPVHEGDTHVCYDVKDLTAVEPLLGTEDDFVDLCARAHGMGMRIVLDIELSYLGSQHPAARACAEDPDDVHAAWFHWSADDPPRRFGWYGGNPTFAALDHRHPQVREVLIDALRTWLDRGVDGFRFDSAHAAPARFWTEVGAAVRQHRPDAFCFVEDTRTTGEWRHQHGRVGGFLDFELAGSLRDLVTPGADVESAAARFADVVERRASLPEGLVPVTFVENHDGDRIDLVTGHDEARLRLALGLLLSLPGVPLLYHGTELGLGQRAAGDCDLVARGGVPWNDPDPDRFEHVRALVDRRRRLTGLRHPHTEVLGVDGGVVALRRGVHPDTVVVVANFTDAPRRLPVDGCGDVSVEAHDLAHITPEMTRTAHG